MTLLRVEDLDCRYGLLQAVRGVSFEVAQGETVALIGANGAGKPRLLRAIAGAHKPHVRPRGLRYRRCHFDAGSPPRVARDRARA